MILKKDHLRLNGKAGQPISSLSALLAPEPAPTSHYSDSQVIQLQEPHRGKEHDDWIFGVINAEKPGNDRKNVEAHRLKTPLLIHSTGLIQHHHQPTDTAWRPIVSDLDRNG
jgi:hypothetical protein